MRKFYIVFFIVNLFLSYFYVDIWTTNSNTASRALPIISFFENGTLQIDKYQEPINDKAHINGHYYTDKAPLPTFVVLPFFGFLKVVGLVKEVDGSLFGTEVFMLGSFICGSLPFVLFMLLALFAIRKKKSISLAGFPGDDAFLRIVYFCFCRNLFCTHYFGFFVAAGLSVFKR